MPGGEVANSAGELGWNDTNLTKAANPLFEWRSKKNESRPLAGVNSLKEI